MNGIVVCVCVSHVRRLLLIKHGTYSHVDLTLQACHYAENTYSESNEFGYRPVTHSTREGNSMPWITP